MTKRNWLEKIEHKIPKVLFISYGQSFERIDIDDLLEFDEKDVRHKLQKIGRRTQSIAQVLATVNAAIRTEDMKLAIIYGGLFEKKRYRQDHESKSTLKCVVDSLVFQSSQYRVQFALVSDLKFQAEVLTDIVKRLSSVAFSMGAEVKLKAAETQTYRDTA